MDDPAFFGYGSLVNLGTHDYPNARRARVSGWRRVWRHTDLRPLAYLSVEPAVGVTIDGITASVPGGDWAALDAREAAYARHDTLAEEHGLGTARTVQIYAVPVPQTPVASEHPILLSYLDVVLQGYLQQFGEPGVAAFIETTAGWQAGVLNDRRAPVYPRHRVLDSAERSVVDGVLAQLAVPVEKL
ncbi:MAG: gamma-glutamylcyclotransferase family protein [Pseudomonadota bacterium]